MYHPPNVNTKRTYLSPPLLFRKWHRVTITLKNLKLKNLGLEHRVLCPLATLLLRSLFSILKFSFLMFERRGSSGPCVTKVDDKITGRELHRNASLNICQRLQPPVWISIYVCIGCSATARCWPARRPINQILLCFFDRLRHFWRYIFPLSFRTAIARQPSLGRFDSSNDWRQYLTVVSDNHATFERSRDLSLLLTELTRLNDISYCSKKIRIVRLLKIKIICGWLIWLSKV